MKLKIFIVLHYNLKIIKIKYNVLSTMLFCHIKIFLKNPKLFKIISVDRVVNMYEYMNHSAVYKYFIITL